MSTLCDSIQCLLVMSIFWGLGQYKIAHINLLNTCLSEMANLILSINSATLIQYYNHSCIYSLCRRVGSQCDTRSMLYMLMLD